MQKKLFKTNRKALIILISNIQTPNTINIIEKKFKLNLSKTSESYFSDNESVHKSNSLIWGGIPSLL